MEFIHFYQKIYFFAVRMFFYAFLIILIHPNHQIELASILNTAARLTESFIFLLFLLLQVFLIILIMLPLV